MLYKTGGLLIVLFVVLFSTGCAKSQEQKELSIKKNSIDIRIEGAVYPVHKQILISSVSGYVNKVYVKNGDRVKKGDLIYTINKQPLLLDIKNTEQEIAALKSIRRHMLSSRTADGNIYAVNIAARELKKIAQLKALGYVNSFTQNRYKKNYINAMYSNRLASQNSYKNLKDLDTSIKTKEIALEKLRFEYRHADMYSRINGFVAGLHVSVGEEVSANSKLGDIVNIDKVIVKAGFATGLLPFIHLHQKVHADFITTPPYSTTAYISQINPVVNPKFQRMTIEMTVANHDYQLQEGTRALITIKLSKQGQEEVRKYFLNNKRDHMFEIKSNI